MTKDDLVEAVAAETSCTEDEVRSVLDAAIDSITQGLVDGDVIDVGPLGRFVPRLENAHEGSNPSTGEPLEIPAQTRVLFHPSEKVREALAEALPEAG